MAKKAPRRTAQRIQEAALTLFNRFGEPHVSTALIASEVGISPGNLHYHYPAKDKLIGALFAQYEQALAELLPAGGGAQDVEDTWFFMHSLFELVWQYRFLYRDLNDLLSRNRLLETSIQLCMTTQVDAMRAMLESLRAAHVLNIDERELPLTANCLMVILTYWLSFEYVRDPRHALEPENGQVALLRGAQHALGLLAPLLDPAQRQHLLRLRDAYTTTSLQPFLPSAS